MIFNALPLTADGNPDDASLLAMKAALRDLKVVLRQPAEHPMRRQMMNVLADARQRIDRINAPPA